MPGWSASAPADGKAVTASARFNGAASGHTFTAPKASCVPSSMLIVALAGMRLLFGPVNWTAPSFGLPSIHLVLPMVTVAPAATSMPS